MANRQPGNAAADSGAAAHVPTAEELLEFARAGRALVGVLTPASVQIYGSMRGAAIVDRAMRMRATPLVQRYLHLWPPKSDRRPEVARAATAYLCERWSGWPDELLDDLLALTAGSGARHLERPEELILTDEESQIVFGMVERIEGAARAVIEEQRRLATTGKKVVEGGRVGHEKAHGNTAEKQNARTEYRAAFEAIYPAKVSKKTRAYKLVAEQFGVSEKTVQRAVGENQKTK